MATKFLVLLVIALMLSAIELEQNFAVQAKPNSGVQQSQLMAQEFVAYRNAVQAYIEQNVDFVGSVPSDSLSGQFSSTFLASAGNEIVSMGGNQREITCYAALPTGSLGVALALTSNDASLGLASGTNWISMAAGASRTPVPLMSTVPTGDVVSVMEIGD